MTQLGLAKVERAKDTRPGRVLGVTMNGVWEALYWQGEVIKEARDHGDDNVRDALEGPPKELQGVVVCENVRWRSLGPGDWPGTQEWGLVGDWRPATEEEWHHFVHCEHVWGEDETSERADLEG